MSTLATISIGQSPRTDVMADFGALLPATIELLEIGALDHLSKAEIEDLAPRDDEFPLVTKLRDGSAVVIGKERLTPLIGAAVRDVSTRCDTILVLCAGRFPSFESRVPVLYPSRLFEHFLRGIGPEAATVLVPHEGQCEPAKRHFGAFIPRIGVAVASPYPWKCPGGLKEVIIMDCLGYSLEMKNDVRRRTGGQVVLIRSVAAAAVRELVG